MEKSICMRTVIETLVAIVGNTPNIQQWKTELNIMI